MTLEILWQVSPDGDGRGHGPQSRSRGDYQGLPARPFAFARTDGRDPRFNYYDHITQVARAAELAGFDGLFIPQTDTGEEPLIVAAALTRETRRITLVPQLPAHFLSAVYAAKIATSFQRLTAGRLALNFVTQPPQPGAWHGISWNEAEQIARLDEFLTVFKGVWNEGPFTFEGQYYEVLNGGFAPPLNGQVEPQIQLSGTSEAALALSARHADVHVFAADSPEQIAERIADLDQRAAAAGRSLRYGLQAELVARHDRDEALAAGAARWAEGAAPDPALIGSFADVATRLEDYHAAGIGTLLLSARPHFEEGYRVAQHILPRLSEHRQPARVSA